MMSSLQQSTAIAYKKHWSVFKNFILEHLRCNFSMPIKTHTIGLFVVYLHRQNLKASTIRTYMSAISYFHKSHGHTDPTASFIVNKALQGVSKQSITTKTPLLPITKTELTSILSAIPFNTNSDYSHIMYRALFLVCFHACLRAGEVVHSNTNRHTLQLDQLQKCELGSSNTFLIKFLSYKHSTDKQQPQVVLTPNPDKRLCPVKAIERYLKRRGLEKGPLFIKENKKPLSRAEFSCFLKDCLELEGLSSECYNTHSFRIGRATQLAQDNAPDSVIQQTGRWKSSAFRKYIRPTYVQLPK